MLNASYAAVKSVAPGDARGHRRNGPVRRSARRQPGSARGVLAAGALRDPREEKAEEAQERAPSASPRPPAARRTSTSSPTTRSIPPGARAGTPSTPNDASSADLDRIARVLRAAERAGTVLPGRHPLWATEMWWDSNPPNSAGSPLGRQARWIEDALYQAWKDGASVVINLVIRDSPTSGRTMPWRCGLRNLLRRRPSQAVVHGLPLPVRDRPGQPSAGSRLGQGAGRGQAGDPAQAREALAGREEAPGSPGAGVRRPSCGWRGRHRLRAVVAGNRSLSWTQR